MFLRRCYQAVKILNSSIADIKSIVAEVDNFTSIPTV